MILYGIGMGPGDPDLVTVGALRAIDEADAEVEIGRASCRERV